MLLFCLACQDLIRKCLAFEPSQRATFDDILNHRWYNGSDDLEINTDSSSSSNAFDRSKPVVCTSVPKNLGGINPQHLRDALHGAHQSPPVPIGQQQHQPDEMMSDSPSTSSIGSPSSDIVQPMNNNPTSLLTGSLIVPSNHMALQHHAATDNSNHPNCRKPAGNHMPAVIQVHNNNNNLNNNHLLPNPSRVDSGLGSAFSSANSSAASSYKSNSSLCGSL